ncbi:MAG: MFS transporter [Dehalococcoidia bacterium]|nr:MFS transporter [Dehalococcoidia bacterium]
MPRPYMTSDARARGPSVNYRLLLLTVSLGGVLAPLNSTMLAVALPELRRQFHVGHAEIAWLVSAYLIAMAVAQPLGGRLGDQAGRVPVFRAGLVLFLLLSLGAALAPSFHLLILMRTGQALVGAAVIPNGMAMLRESVPVNRLGRSNGLTGSAMSIAAAVGPLLGAGLLALGSWRLLFLMNVPLVAAAFVSLALLRYPGARLRRAPLSLDWVGALAFAALLVAVTLLLNALRGQQSDAAVAAALIALPVLLLAFIYRQFSAPSPMAEWRLFRIRSYSAATAYILFSNLVMYTTILTLPFFLEEVQGKGHLVTGSLLGAVSLPVAALAPLGGRLSDSFGRRPLVLVGGLLVLAGVAALLAGIRQDVPYAFLAGALALMGAGLGLSVGPGSAAAIESSPRELAGAAAGANSMMRYIGSIVGAGILGAVLNSGAAAPGIGLFQLIFAVLVVMSALGCVAALFVHRFPADFRLSRPPEPALAPAGAAPGPDF